MDYFLREAIHQKKLEVGPDYELASDQSVFKKMYHDIAHAANSWFLNSIRIVDIGNWRFKNLIKMDEKAIRIKKPKLLLSVELTPQDCLVLNWYPVSVSKSATYHELPDESAHAPVWQEEESQSWESPYGDWLVWDCQERPGGEIRQNTIIQVQNFGKLLAVPGQPKKLPKSEQYLLKATQSLLENIIGYLEQLVDAEIQDVLVVEQVSGDMIGRICSYQEVEAEQKRLEKKEAKHPVKVMARKKPVQERVVPR